MKTKLTDVLKLAVALIALVAAGPASAANLVYFYEGHTSQARGIYDYDTTTGISTIRASVAGANFGNPRMLAFDRRPSDGTVFAADHGANRLMTIDEYTGVFATIGTPPGGRVYVDLSFQPGTETLFGTQFESGSTRRTLITIDTSNGSITEIGDFSFSGTGSTALEFLDDGTLLLYESVASSGRLYEVDPTNAQLTLIGNTTGINTLSDFTNIGNQLYATSFGQGGNFMWQIDVATGAPTPLNAPTTTGGHGGLIATSPIGPALCNGALEAGSPPASWTLETVAVNETGSCNLLGNEKAMVTDRAHGHDQSFKGRVRLDCNQSGAREYWAMARSAAGNTINVPPGQASAYRYITFWANPETGLSCTAPGQNDCQHFSCQWDNYDARNRLIVAFFDAAGQRISGSEVLADHHGTHVGNCSRHVGESLNEPGAGASDHWFRLASEATNPGDAEELQTVGGRDWYRYTVEIPDMAATRGTDIRVGVGPGHFQNWESVGETLLWIDDICLSDSTGACRPAGTAGAGATPPTITLQLVSPTQLRINWARSTCAGGCDHAIYEGTIGLWYSHGQIDCSDDGRDLTEVVTFGGGNTYYLVVPHNGVEEGSYGTDSSAIQRPVPGNACASTQVLSCALP